MSLLKDALLRARKNYRQWRLEAGESGWGKPAPPRPLAAGLSADKSYRVGIVGAGRQGIAQCQGVKSVKGLEIAGLADINSGQLQKALQQLGLPSQSGYESLERMVDNAGPIDLLCIATTAPSHIALGRVALQTGIKNLLIEKPIASSLAEARRFVTECEMAGVKLAVNYSRRWLHDYRAIKRCIERGVIGEVRSITVIIGKGELAMHGSHYFDLCRYLTGSEPATVISQLEPIREANLRGDQYQDPSGYCLFTFTNGARAYIDFSSDLQVKDPFVTIKGSTGRITVDEQRLFWTLQSRSQRTWTFPFVEQMKSSLMFARVVAELVSGQPPGVNGADGVSALQMVYGALLSDRRGSQPIVFPLTEEDAAIEIAIP